MITLEIKMNQAGQRLDKFLGKYLPQAPAGFFYKMLRKKNITLNGKKAEGKEILQLKDRVTLWLADETILKLGGYLPGQDQADSRENLYCQAFWRLKGITVLYEDAHVLILDKPAGVLTQQAREGDLSLNEWMIGYLLDTGAITSRELRLFKPSVCNRLDRNTSGLVLCGKSLPGSQALGGLIRSRALGKFYRTICVGTMETAELGTAIEMQGYLQKNSRTNRVIIHNKETLHNKKAGEYIRTVYRPIEQLCIPAKSLGGNQMKPDAFQEGCSLTELEVELITGKPHQIRAHLASVGHPLVGDSKYGNASVNQLFRQRFGLCWQLLHAHRLQFPVLDGVLAPLSGRSIQAPLPDCFEAVLRELKASEGGK